MYRPVAARAARSTEKPIVNLKMPGSVVPCSVRPCRSSTLLRAACRVNGSVRVELFCMVQVWLRAREAPGRFPGGSSVSYFCRAAAWLTARPGSPARFLFAEYYISYIINLPYRKNPVSCIIHRNERNRQISRENSPNRIGIMPKTIATPVRSSAGTPGYRGIRPSPRQAA